MTIEQYLKPFLKEQLQEKLEDYNVLLGLDISEGTLKQVNDVIFQIKTGTSTLSTVRGITEKTTPTQIYFKCLTNDFQPLLTKINEFIDELNTQVVATPDNSLNIELLFTTPTLILTQDETIKNDTFSISYGMFTLNSYATNLPIIPYEKFLVIDGVEYELEQVQSFSNECVYNYGYSQTDNPLGENKFQSMAINYTITMLKTNTSFCNFVDNNQYVLQNKVVVIKQKKDGQEIMARHCIILNIAINETTGIPIITLVLKGV